MLGCALQQNAHTAHIWFTISIWHGGTILSHMFSTELQAAWHLTSNLGTVIIMTQVNLYFPLNDLGIAESITYSADCGCWYMR